MEDKMTLNPLQDTEIQPVASRTDAVTATANVSVAFDGSIPETYDRRLGPLLFDFAAADTARRVAELAPDVADVLEIAAGTGISTEFLWKVLPPTAKIVATDLSDDMLDYARTHRGAFQNVIYQKADALDLPFEDQSFDLVVCQFGIMFFKDKDKGFAEFARVLKPGGRLVFNVWDSYDHNPIARIAQETIETFFNTNPPQFLRVPWGFSEIDPIRELVSDAGLVRLDVQVVSETVARPNAKDIARGFVEGNPTILTIREHGTVDADEVIDAVARAIKAEYGSGTLHIPLQEIFFSARKG
jgi:ubiquinone/menaquinone biosynthesis C-methylase UbiE